MFVVNPVLFGRSSGNVILIFYWRKETIPSEYTLKLQVGI